MGRPGLSPRTVLRALIIKHMKKLDDLGTIEEIQENSYMQYFIGLKEFTTGPVLDPSLFVEIRKRIGKESFDSLNELLIKSMSWEKDQRPIKKKKLHGYYPELVQVDKIYATRENRRWLKERGIRITASPLGSPVKQSAESYYQKRKKRKEAVERNAIEGKFGQGKNGYELNRIRARLRNTSESWISCISFVMNLLRYENIYFWLIFYRHFLSLRNSLLINIFSRRKMSPILATL